MLRPVDGVRSVSYTSAPGGTPEATSPPRDRFELATGGPEPDVRDAARLLDSNLRLDKAKTDYRETAWCAAPDGTVYAGYSEAEGTRGYVSSAAPDGAIRWELAFDEGRIQEVTVLPDGRLAVATPKGVTVAGPDGRIQSREPARATVADLEVDGTGARYVILGEERRLQARAADGSPLSLSRELADARVASLGPAPDGGVLVRTSQEAWKLSPGGQAEAVPMPQWPPQGDTKHEVTGSWAMPDGDVLLLKQSTTTTWPPFHHGMEHDPMFGGQWIRTPDITVQNALVRVSPQGDERWAVGELGEKVRPVVLSDGSACFVAPSGPEGKRTVEVLDGQGRRRPAFQVASPILDLRPGLDDTLLVHHGSTVSRYSAEGKALESAQVPSGRRLQGEGGPGRLIFSEPEGKSLWSCDVRTGSWSLLTDPVGDHSVALTLENLHEEAGPAPEVREDDGWIAIGGVRLPVRPD